MMKKRELKGARRRGEEDGRKEGGDEAKTAEKQRDRYTQREKKKETNKHKSESSAIPKGKNELVQMSRETEAESINQTFALSMIDRASTHKRSQKCE